MPVPDLSIYKVADTEQSSATKFSNFVQAVQAEFGDIDADQIPGYPGSVAAFLRGDGAWAGAYTAYTPVWTASGTAPSLGNGTIAGRYLQIGRAVVFSVKLVFGSTTTFGTGVYFLTYPPLTPLDLDIVAGSGAGHDTGVQLYSLSIATDSATRFSMLSGNANVTNVAPFTWASGDKIVIVGSFEVT